MRLFTILILILCLFQPTTPLFAGDLVIHAGRLLAVPGEPALTKQTIIISDNKITKVAAGFLDPTPGSTLIDLKDQFVLPGLMDMHVHLLVELGPNTRTRQVTESSALVAMRGVANARKTLEAGFTTVRDLGGSPESSYAISDAVKANLISGPRIFAAGSAIAATGGHGDVDGIRSDLMKLWTPETICDGAVECRKTTRHAIKYGADWIKITATGGVLSDTATGLGAQMTDGELEEIVETAHNLGVRVAAHAHGSDGVNAALRAGVDTIDHGTFLDKESIKLLKKNDAYLVPTLMPGHFIPLSMEGNPFFTDAIKQKANEAAASSKQSFALAHEANVKIAFGTDTGVTPHGQNSKEFSLMVASGMSAADAIHAATVVASELLEISNRLGTIEVGKLADLIAVDGDPLQDISVLENVTTVIKDGKIEKTSAVHSDQR
jgi:imidazolonepropionase-like amidohydrolase